MGTHDRSPESDDTKANAVTSFVSGAITVAGVPLLVMSQWLTIRWDFPARLAFNAVLFILLAVVLALGFSGLRRYRAEAWLALAIGVVLGLSLLFNAVPPRVAITGVVPYVGMVLAALAGLVSTPRASVIRRGAIVSGATVLIMAGAAVIELAFGGRAYELLGQAIEYPRWWERGRATGLVANPGRLGQIGVAGISLAPAIGRIGAPTVVVALAGAFLVGASGTRVAVAASIGLLAAWLFTRSVRTSRLLLVGAIAAPVMFALVIAIVPSARADFFDRSEAIIVDGGEFPADVRVANAGAVGRLVADRPVLGAGPGQFGSTTAWRNRSELHAVYDLPDLRSEEFVAELRERGDDREIDFGVAQLDLGWGQVVAETGILGLVLFAGLLLALFVRAVRVQSPAAAALVVGLSVLSLASPGLVDFSLAAVMLWWAGALIATEGAHGSVERSGDSGGLPGMGDVGVS